jgi:hypothetical protein
MRITPGDKMRIESNSNTQVLSELLELIRQVKTEEAISSGAREIAEKYGCTIEEKSSIPCTKKRMQLIDHRGRIIAEYTEMTSA